MGFPFDLAPTVLTYSYKKVTADELYAHLLPKWLKDLSGNQTPDFPIAKWLLHNIDNICGMFRILFTSGTSPVVYSHHLATQSSPKETHIYTQAYTHTHTHSNHDSRMYSPSFDLDKVLLKPTYSWL